MIPPASRGAGASGAGPGSLVNRAHPAEAHPAMDCAMDVLLDLEAAAQARGDATEGS